MGTGNEYYECGNEVIKSIELCKCSSYILFVTPALLTTLVLMPFTDSAWSIISVELLTNFCSPAQEKPKNYFINNVANHVSVLFMENLISDILVGNKILLPLDCLNFSTFLLLLSFLVFARD